MGKTQATMPAQVPVDLDAAQATAAAEVLKAVANPLRLRILCLLSSHEENVKNIAGALNVFPAVVSQQLRILRSAGLVSGSTRGGHTYYGIVEPHMYEMLSCIEKCIKDRGR